QGAMMLGRLAALLVLVVSCKAQEELKLTLANNRFGLRLFHALPSAAEVNVFFSPYSVSTAMGMTYAGARRDTAEELFRGLGYSASGLTAPQVLDSYARHTQRLLSSESQSTLKVANGVAIQENLTLLDSFRNTLESSFNAEVHQVDFVHRKQDAFELLNRWVKQKTSDKIDKLFDEPLSPATKLVLLNAIYFKGVWNTQFRRVFTQKRKFWNGGVSPTLVDTMMQNMHVGYGSFGDLDVDVAELPYRGRDYSMVILLPKRNDGVDRLKGNLTVEIM
ncbi:serpin-2 precursor, putative, partial [Ixodes scapularis]